MKRFIEFLVKHFLKGHYLSRNPQRKKKETA